MLLVRRDPLHAPLPEDVQAPCEHTDRGEELVDDHGLHDVELQLPCLRPEGHGQVVAERLEAAHVRDLGDHGVYLAGHDGRARCHGREVDLREATPRAGGQEPQIVADLRDLYSHAAQDAGQEQHGAQGGARLDQVVCQRNGEARHLPELLHHRRREVRIRGDASADGRAAQVGDHEPVDGVLHGFQVIVHRRAVCVKLLAQRHGHGVLQLRPSHLHHAGEVPALREEGVAELLDGLQEFVVHEDCRDLGCSGVGVVGGLALVHIVVGAAVLVLALLLTHVL
mmetsp:Transcript_82372/g.207255  ORF Transcript_82372/g.207255 Transcript_82372/m.207255 type:complete len:282 (-) Transcript_82372:523-1368(-)